MPSYGSRPQDVVQDVKGSALGGVVVKLYTTEALAKAGGVPDIDTVKTDSRGRWEVNVASGQVWARVPDGTVWSVAGETGFATPADVAAGYYSKPEIDSTVQALSTQVSDLGTNKVSKGEIVVNVKDYGAVGNGIADDTSAINAALAAGAGGRVEFPRGGNYRATSGLAVPSFTTVVGNGATLDFTSMPNATALGQRIGMTVQGSIGGDLPISTAITQWSRTVAGISSTASLAAGDLVLIENDERPVPGMTRTDRDKGELAIIQSVDSATQVTLTAGALFAYGTTGLKMRKMTPAERVTIDGLSLKMRGVGSAHNGIQVRYGRDITVRNVQIDGAEDIAIGLNTVWNGKVSGCQILNATSSTTLGNTGYGVAVVEGSRHCVVSDNNFYNCRHFVAGGGYWPAVFVDVKGNQGVRSSAAGYDCHEPCFYWTFTKNTAVGVTSGFIIRGQYITVEDCEVTDSQGHAIRVATFDGTTEQRGFRAVNNKATSCVYGIEVDGQALGAEPNSLKIDVEIRGNYLRNAGANPILLRHFDGAKVDSNDVIGSTSHALLLVGLSGIQSRYLDCNNNKVRNAGLDSIKVQFVDDVTINGGQLLESGGTNIELLTCNRTATTGTVMRTHARDGMLVTGGATHVVSGVSISGGATAGYDALRLSGTASVTVNGGYFASARIGVNSTTTDYVVITGVNARDSASGTKVASDATNKVVTNNLV